MGRTTRATVVEGDSTCPDAGLTHRQAGKRIPTGRILRGRYVRSCMIASRLFDCEHTSPAEMDSHLLNSGCPVIIQQWVSRCSRNSGCPVVTLLTVTERNGLPPVEQWVSRCYVVTVPLLSVVTVPLLPISVPLLPLLAHSCFSSELGASFRCLFRPRLWG